MPSCQLIFAPVAVLLLAGCAPVPAPAPIDTPTSVGTAPPLANVASPPADAATPSAATLPAPSVGLHIALSGDGLSAVTDSGSARHLAFGSDTDMVVGVVTRAEGAEPTSGRNGECGAGPVDMATWGSGLTLLSQDGRFVGWSVNPTRGRDDRRRPATIAGLALGSTRQDLAAAYAADIRQTSLGTEFSAGGMAGVLDGGGPDARVTALWAGTSCVFR